MNNNPHKLPLEYPLRKAYTIYKKRALAIFQIVFILLFAHLTILIIYGIRKIIPYFIFISIFFIPILLIYFNYYKKKSNEQNINALTQLANINLSKSSLKGINLSEANLKGINLSGADLSNADLSRANLSNADLSRANLSNTDLNGANLKGASLTNTILNRTNFSDVNLNKANLKNASFFYADLNGASLIHTNLLGVNLSNTKVTKAYFGNNKGISEDIKIDLKRRGAIFKEFFKLLIIEIIQDN